MVPYASETWSLEGVTGNEKAWAVRRDKAALFLCHPGIHGDRGVTCCVEVSEVAPTSPDARLSLSNSDCRVFLSRMKWRQLRCGGVTSLTTTVALLGPCCGKTQGAWSTESTVCNWPAVSYHSGSVLLFEALPCKGYVTRLVGDIWSFCLNLIIAVNIFWDKCFRISLLRI